MYGFEAISNNSGVSGAMALQLSVDVTDPGTIDPDNGYNQVLFTFYNDGPSPSIYDVSSPEDGVITGVYLEDGALLLMADVIYFDAIANNPSYSGLDFGQPIAPPKMPGWNLLDPDFQTTAAFSVDSETPHPIVNAISPGESLGLLYTLQFDKTFDDILTALSLGMTDPAPNAGTSLRIGLFVQNLGENGEFSDTFITPIPTSVVLGMLGLGVVGLKLRKFA